jgi:hypothetical protein
MTQEQSLDNILESIAKYCANGQLGLLAAAVDAFERVSEARRKAAESQATDAQQAQADTQAGSK